MNTKKHSCILMHLLLFLIGLSMITSCGKQGVISAKTDNYSEPQITENDEPVHEITSINIVLEGGTGKAGIESPATVTGAEGNYFVKLVWSSKNYDYMIVGEEKYLNENEGGNSTFTIPVTDFDKPLEVVADTVAMSKPHEIEYTLFFSAEETEEETYIETLQKDVVDSIDIGIEGEKLDLQYANQFEITRYGDYFLIVIKNEASYLCVPEGKEIPDGIPSEITVLQQPLDKTYLVSTSVMDLIRQCGALDCIALSGTKEQDWCIEEAAKAMQNGEIVYAGKYSAPDYEQLLSRGCNFAIENTMIYHKPEVKDKLEELGIPVLIEHSSYEEHPLGRMEWIKLYGILYGKEDEAEQFFNAEVEKASGIIGSDSDVSVAFFYVTSGGMINARLSTDYIAKMIEMAGGRYCLTTDKESASSVATANMQMEDFYLGAGDADILIYNSTIGGEISSIDELVAKNVLFGDFKAVKEGNVYCTGKDFFQESTGTVEFMNDLKKVYTGSDEPLTYLYKVEK